MSKTTKKIMAKFRRKLRRYVGLEQTHCGHESLAVQAMNAGEDLEVWLENKIEELVKKAGVE